MQLDLRSSTQLYKQIGHIFLVQYGLGLSEFNDIFGIKMGEHMFKIFEEKKRNLLDYLFTGGVSANNLELMFDYAEKQIQMDKKKHKKKKLF